MAKSPSENPIDICGCQVKRRLTGFELQMELLRCARIKANWEGQAALDEMWTQYQEATSIGWE